jgi:hypothetical protein
MTPNALQRLALSLPDAHEEPHFERTSFRVGKKIFATMTPDGKEAMVRVSPDGVQALLSSYPDVFFSYGGWTIRNGSLGVRLAKVDAAMMKELVTDSWKHAAPRRTVAAFEEGTEKERQVHSSRVTRRA